jgi:hypothetical protein
MVPRREPAARDLKPQAVCPGCRATLPPGAVVCIECGHDLRTGSRLSRPESDPMPRAFGPKKKAVTRKRKTVWPVLILVILLVVAIGGGATWLYLWTGGRNVPGEATAPPPPAKADNAAAVPGSGAVQEPAQRVPPAVGLQGVAEPAAGSRPSSPQAKANPIEAARRLPRESRQERIVRQTGLLDGATLENWHQALQNAGGGGLSKESCMFFLADFNRLYEPNAMRAGESAKLLGRIRLVPADHLAAWEAALSKAIQRKLIPGLPDKAAALVVIIQQDALFGGAGFDTALSQTMAQRIATIPRAAIEAVTMAAGQNSALEDTDAATALAAYEPLFAGGSFQAGAWQEVLASARASVPETPRGGAASPPAPVVPTAAERPLNPSLTYAQVRGAIDRFAGERVAWRGYEIAYSSTIQADGKRQDRHVYLIESAAEQPGGDQVVLLIGPLTKTDAAKGLDQKNSALRRVLGTIQGASDYRDPRGVTVKIPVLVDVVLDAPEAVAGGPPGQSPRSGAVAIARPGLLGTGIGVMPKAEMDKVNRRMKKVERTAMVDELVKSLKELTGKNLAGQGFLAVLMFLPQVESLWQREELQRARAEELIRRAAKLKPSDVRQWNEAIDKLCRPLGGGATDLETVGFLIQMDRLFSPEGFRGQESQALLARLGTLTPASVKQVAERIDGYTSQAAIMLIQHDGLFQQNRFQENSLGAAMERFTAKEGGM